MFNRTHRTVNAPTSWGLPARALPTLAAGTAVLLAAFAPAAFAQGNRIGQLNVITPPMRPAAVQTAAVPAQPAPKPPMSQPAAIEPPQQQASSPTSVLEAVGTGDTLRITVFRNPDLTTESRVTEQGTITFPLIGDVKVTGLSPQQVGATIAEKLRTGRFVVNPEVSVAVAQVNSRQVSVLGNVNRPGRYPIDAANSKLTDFIAAAGGVAGPGSDVVTVVQVRNGQSAKTDVDLSRMFRDGNLSANLELQPGDTIFVHKAPMVYVYGEVQKAGAYRLEPHMTVMQAIAMGGGLTVRGTERGVRIHRRDANGNVKKIDVALTDPVQTDDVVFVRESLF